MVCGHLALEFMRFRIAEDICLVPNRLNLTAKRSGEFLTPTDSMLTSGEFNDQNAMNRTTFASAHVQFILKSGSFIVT